MICCKLNMIYIFHYVIDLAGVKLCIRWLVTLTRLWRNSNISQKQQFSFRLTSEMWEHSLLASTTPTMPWELQWPITPKARWVWLGVIQATKATTVGDRFGVGPGRSRALSDPAQPRVRAVPSERRPRPHAHLLSAGGGRGQRRPTRPQRHCPAQEHPP